LTGINLTKGGAAAGNHAIAQRKRIPPDRLGAWTLFGATISLCMLGGVGAWAATTAIDGAVVASAKVVVETNRKTVQHFEGGIVRTILVRDGDHVRQGQVLVKLDTTRDRSELVALQDRLVDLTARRARLLAELKEAEHIDWPDTVLFRAQEPRVAAVIDAQQRLFRSRHAAREAEATLLKKRAAALDARIDGLANQANSMRQELALTTKENDLLKPLLEKTLVRMPRILEVRRKIARLRSQLAASAGEQLSLQAQIEETHAEAAENRARFRESAASRLIEVQAEIAELEERRSALRDRLNRRDVKAPQSGRVFNLAVHSEGAVVASGDPLMEIVPVNDDLVLRARVPATDVERVLPGLAATVRLIAFNRNTTPELVGTVETVAADALLDEQSDGAFYTATVRLGAEQLARLDGQSLTPGMPAEVLIRTGERLVASYLMRPLVDSYARTFRDE